MHVLPAYQRRGLGQRLMEEAILDADKDGAKVYLSASDAGRCLYVKYGFKDLEVKYIDFTHLGAIGARNTTAMMRQGSRMVRRGRPMERATTPTPLQPTTRSSTV